ncbi:MAG: helix-turn-helix domain-containing protein [Acidimicrobiales bacterium]
MRAVKEILPSVVSPTEAHELANVLLFTTGISRSDRTASLVGADGSKKELPAPLYDLLVTVVGILESGSGVTVVPLGAELTTAETAELLSVSRPHAIKMLEAGEIPYHKVGTHRRVFLEDVLKFREARNAQFNTAMSELHELTDEMNLPD